VTKKDLTDQMIITQIPILLGSGIPLSGDLGVEIPSATAGPKPTPTALCSTIMKL
jgi:hypothetical protein